MKIQKMEELVIKINTAKVLETAVELAESRIYFQNVSEGTTLFHDSRETRSFLREELSKHSTDELLKFCQQMLTLQEIGRMSSARFDRIKAYSS